MKVRIDNEEPEDDQAAVIGAASLEQEVAEIEDEVLSLKEQLRDIQTQLAGRDQRYPKGHDFAGRRMTVHDYWKWRRSAVAAIGHITTELSRANADLKDAKDELRRSRATEQLRVIEQAGHGGHMLQTLRRAVKRGMMDYGLTLTPVEQAVMDELQEIGSVVKNVAKGRGVLR